MITLFMFADNNGILIIDGTNTLSHELPIGLCTTSITSTSKNKIPTKDGGIINTYIFNKCIDMVNPYSKKKKLSRTKNKPKQKKTRRHR
tara:strand:- start:1355 stop:1621 length:267 start_codon:yes stop_codon:yes gene_type:complete